MCSIEIVLQILNFGLFQGSDTMLDSSTEPQLPVNHCSKRVNNRYTYKQKQNLLLEVFCSHTNAVSDSLQQSINYEIFNTIIKLVLFQMVFLTTFTIVQAKLGEGNGNPLQYSCLENPMGGGAWQAAVHGVTKSRTQLSDFTFAFHFHALEKERQPIPVFLPGEFQGLGSLVGCRLWGRTESAMTEATQQQQQQQAKL